MIVPTMIVDGGSKAKISTFVYNGVSYQFEVGMTWSDFVSSEYNTTGICTDGGIVMTNGGDYRIAYPCININFVANVDASDFVTNIEYVAKFNSTSGGGN